MKIRKIADAMYSIGENILIYLFLIMIGILALFSLIFTESANNMLEQFMVLSVDKIYLTVPIMLVMVGLCILAGIIAKRCGKNTITVLVAVVCVWYFVCGAMLFFFARSAPGADAMTVYYMAESVSRGDLSIVDAQNSYLSYYPQQIGLVTFLAIILKGLHLFKLPAEEYHFIKFVYLFLICIAMVAQNYIVRRLWKSDFVNAVFLVLSAINLPYILYATFIYSEIPSYCFFSVGACLLTALLSEDGKEADAIDKKDKIKNMLTAIASIIMFALAVMLRKNVLVLIIAVVITVFFKWLKSKKWEWLIYISACIACCVAILPFVLWGYEQLAGSEISSGVTAKSYFAMGMQEGGRGPGWYNGFNFSTFEAADKKPEVADIISEAAIEESLQNFKEHPGYAARFYSRKISTQWLDGTYASLQATYATVSNRADFFWQVYEGKYTDGFIAICNAFQSLVYISVFLCMLRLVIKKENNCFWKYLFAICVVGGFLFHIIWEANSRYIVTYSLLLIPYASKGIANMYDVSVAKLNKNRKQL